jgi:glycosyltransferase involved in cell wall biosynthesis
MFKSDVLIMIPAFNEVGTIGDVISLAMTYGDVLVLDDASDDDTRAEALRVGGKVITNDENIGYEKNLSSGFIIAINNQRYRYLVTIDADGEHDPLDIHRFIQKLTSGTDLVCGNRSYKNRFSEKVWGRLVSMVYGISDPLCGLKGYSLGFIRQSQIPLQYCSLGTHIGTNLLKQMVKLNCSSANIDIKVFQREGESRFGAGIGVNVGILVALVRFFRA